MTETAPNYDIAIAGGGCVGGTLACALAQAGLEPGSGTARVDGAQFRTGGDVITAVDGDPVSGMDDLIAAIDSRQPGDEVTLDVIRDGEEQQVDVTLGDRPSKAPS